MGFSPKKHHKKATKSAKKATKSAKKAVKAPIKIAKNAIKNPKAFASGMAGSVVGALTLGGPWGATVGYDIGFTAAGGKSNITGEMLGTAGDAIGGSVGRELDRWANDYTQIIKVMSGEYHEDMDRLTEMEEALNDQVKKYNNGLQALIDKMDSLIAFHEIFHMALANRIDNYTEMHLPKLNEAMEEYKKALAKLKSEYDFIIGLTQGTFLEKLFASLLLIAGGLARDLKAIVNGDAKGENWKRVITVIITIVVVIFMWWNPVGWYAIATAVLGTIAAFMTLDSMYAGGVGMGAIMSSLDFLFNDVMNLDDLVGSDFDKFDSDHKDYQEMVTWVKISMTLTMLILSLGSSGTSSGADTAGTAGTAGADTAGFMGVSSSTYASLYDAYKIASAGYDVYEANKAHKELKEKLEADRDKLETAITAKLNKNMMKHYKDTAYFLQDQQEFIDRYVWEMTSQNMYVDPYGTTPVANIRFTPDKDTRMMAFGFEDMFDESKAAGSKGYFNSILYGS